MGTQSMELGAALGSILNVPRLTSRLRTASGSKPQTNTFDDLYRRRAQQLAERRQDQADISLPLGATGARSILISATLGDWKRAPKPARDAFDAFIYVTSKLLSQGEASSAEVTETAAAAWDALYAAPAVSNDDIKRKGAAAAELHRAVSALQPVLGSHLPSETVLREFIASYTSLCAWQQQLNPQQRGGDGGDEGESPAQQHQQHLLSSQNAVDTSHAAVSWSTEEEAILATCGLPRNHPASLLLLNRLNASLSSTTPGSTSLERKTERVPSTATEEVVAKVEAEVFGANKGLGVNQAVGARWLGRWCNTVTFGKSTTAGWSSTNDASDDDSVPTTVALMLLNATVSDDALAAELFDLLGESVFDHIATLLDQRRSLATNLRSMISTLREAEAADMAAARGGSGPSYGTTVSVMSESEKLMLKSERKAERRKAKQLSNNASSGVGGFNSNGGPDEDAEWLSRYGLGILIEEEIEKEDSAMKIKLGDGMEFRLGEGAGTRGTLPKGTTRKVYKGYEEVHVPAIATAVAPPTEKKVFIEDLPGWAQAAFEGYTALNRIQSRIFTTAFTSNENMLVCAPTGAGKTNIAMISILREVSQNMIGNTINRNDFKIVYVAPMKALAAEVTASFSKRLAPLGLSVRELTGDMQLSKKEMAETQMIVTTPEKWDVITRKGGEVSVAASVRLLIIDEVHLLNDERGPVIETLVARTTRQVETTQSMIRIVGLSATLPNYKDVATFLGVNHSTGLFYFDASYRPVPLQTSFAGVSEKNFLARSALMDEICYQKVVDAVRKGHQAMVFVHSRKDTGKTARMLALKAQQNGDTALFDCSEESGFPHASKDIKKSRNKEVQEVFENGIGLHHAGMLRSDRNLMERLFGSGCLKVLCCTATLAWGVNLPAHTVIIKGTQLYNPQKGGFTDLGMLDVQQIFGRAGRPQFQDSGEAAIITTHDKLAHYLGMLTHAVPIESQFTAGLVDHLNAEIVLGTVTNVREAVAWLGYTYLYVRMRQNPLPYGISWEELASDHSLEGHRRKLIHEAARELERAKMARFDERSGNLYVTELGRVASHFYIRQASIEVYNELLKPHMTTEDILSMIAKSSEFENLAVRDEELIELDGLARSACPYDPRGGSENKHGKANILLQAYISRTRMDSFSLIADSNYVAQNAPRLARALFEICLRFGWSSAAELCLTVSKCFEHRLWPDQHPLWQFDSVLKYELIRKLEERHFDLEQLRDMSPSDIGAALRHPAAGPQIAAAVSAFPTLGIEANLHPITRTVLRIQLALVPEFSWRDNIHGAALRWLVWVEDSENEKIYHSEMWTLTKKMWKEGAQKISFAVPISEPLPPQYYIRAVSDSWLGSEALLAVSFKGLILPERHPPHTELLDLDPLPLSALGNPTYQALYTRFSHFNPIQTQAFHTLYHTDENVLLGAPTGSGKTISAELTLLRLFTAHPGAKAVYIAPLKALVRERIKDWSSGFCAALGKRLVELTGDFTPDLKALLSADVIIATPEKWDGISRNWKGRAYVRKVGLMVMDEIHLLGADRGPILEVIVSRMRYVSAQSGIPIRFVGLSTALANASDLADWLGVGKAGLFNFKPSVRPVPLECHIQGYPGKFYCPRMATMNKPAYAAIQTHSPIKPTLIFVASRRQTRLTALDLIAYAAADSRPRAFLRMPDEEIDQILPMVKDTSLRHTLQFGVGLHHAGLGDDDRSLVERLFVEGKTQVLVATSTLAWGVNTPAHLVIVKGTEFFDAPSKRYVDYPITDVLQMMGRAGRPQYDRHGVAVIMVHEPKKSFYKKFLYEPFPVESSLPGQLADHLNAEIVGGSIRSRQDAVDYLTWTFFLRRLLQNPSYYNLESVEDEAVSKFLSELVGGTLEALAEAGCVALNELNQGGVECLTPGRIASFYYLKHATMAAFAQGLGPGMQVQDVLRVLCSAAEYAELPVRHNEDQLNAGLAGQVRYPPDLKTVDDPHTKASLLLQAHLSRLPLPISDYITDTKSVLDNSLRILQAIVDVAADAGWADTAFSAMKLVQALMQGRWHDDPPAMMLPGIHNKHQADLLGPLPALISAAARDKSGNLVKRKVEAVVAGGGGAHEMQAVLAALERLPAVQLNVPKITKKKAQDHEELLDDQGTDGAQETWDVEVSIVRTAGRVPRGNTPPRVYAPRFPKIKEEGWWLAAIGAGSNELLALKRVSLTMKTKVTLTLPSYSYTSGTGVEMHLICDSYLGLDHSHTIQLKEKK
ncbi:hypothetical protein Ndes2526B_g09336 [Nannochloris sp. 'desiccata']